MTTQPKSDPPGPLDVLVVGCTAADIVAQTVENVPEKGSSAIFDHYEIHMGGNAANVTVNIAKLGMQVGLCSKVGNDELGRFCIKSMEKVGVNLKCLVQSQDHSTACSLILVPHDGNRRILHAPGATQDFNQTDVPETILTQAEFLCVTGFFCLPGLDGTDLASLLKRAKTHGLTTSLDCSVNHRISDWCAFIEPAFPFLDIIFPSEEEAQCITQKNKPREMTDFFRERGIKIAGVKLGEKGCVISYENEYHEIPAYQIKVVDTCGAGDAFMAGFLTALKKGQSPREAARFGNAAGALCIEQLGATTGIKTFEEVHAFQKQAQILT